MCPKYFIFEQNNSNHVLLGVSVKAVSEIDTMHNESLRCKSETFCLQFYFRQLPVIKSTFKVATTKMMGNGVGNHKLIFDAFVGRDLDP